MFHLWLSGYGCLAMDQEGLLFLEPLDPSQRRSAAWYTLWCIRPAGCTRGRPGIIGGGSAELPTTILDLRMVVQKTSLVGQIGVYVEGMCGVDIDLNPLGLTILPRAPVRV